MIGLAIAYIAVLVVMGVMDFTWLRLTVEPIYHRALGDLLAEKPNMTAAVIFSLLYAVGVVLFAVRPALTTHDWRQALLWGALFGLFAYATYDLTNMATLRVWSLKVTVIDMAWGMVITGVSAAAASWTTLALTK
jgi:uncharacterized membrane protein